MPTLNWIGKDAVVNHHLNVPFHLLKDVPELGCGDPGSGNLIVQGDNLVALKALLPYYKGKVKCICIDPPYNTGNEGWAYNDNVNSPAMQKWLKEALEGRTIGKEGETLDRHDRWLCMMYPRIALLREFLTHDGTIWVFLDDNEIHALRYLMDELFGSSNFLNQVSVKMKLTAGASGGGEDKKLKKNIEYVVVYTRDKEGDSGFQKFNDVFDEEDLFEMIDEMDAEGKSWKYTSVLLATGDFVEERIVADGAGDPIRVRKFKGVRRTTINALIRAGATREDAYIEHFDAIFSDTNAQTSIRTRIIDEFNSLAADELLEAEYVPRSGRDKGQTVKHYYISPTIRRVIWLKDTATKKGRKLIKLEKTGTYWDGFPLNNLTKEGGVQFPQGKKPEALIKKILELATNQGDLVLDSFLGSGTIPAVAHKMGRQWLGVELENHAETHCVPRLRKVIESGDSGGITKEVKWAGGGGFRYVRLGDALFDETGQIRSTVRFAELARHVYFTETGEPLPKERVSSKSPLLGIHHGKAIYLLYNGILKDRSINGGNALCRETLQIIEEINDSHEGIEQTVVFGTSQRLSPARLKRGRIDFKQIPYHLRIS